MKTALARFLTDELLSGVATGGLGSDEDLLASGLLDSLGVMQLVWFIEQEFDVQVPAEDVTLENFQSVDRIADYLCARRGSPEK